MQPKDTAFGRILIDFDPPAPHSPRMAGAGPDNNGYFNPQEAGHAGVVLLSAIA